MRNLKTICDRAIETLAEIERLKLAYKRLDQFETVLSRYPEEIKKHGLSFVDMFDGKNARWKAVCIKQTELVRMSPPARYTGPFKTAKKRKGRK